MPHNFLAPATKSSPRSSRAVGFDFPNHKQAGITQEHSRKIQKTTPAPVAASFPPARLSGPSPRSPCPPPTARRAPPSYTFALPSYPST
uniref:Uncharacterized protein n=1 Tax=Setaria italica TaxID=4555 RepID=K3YFR0_SETIT